MEISVKKNDTLFSRIIGVVSVVVPVLVAVLLFFPQTGKLGDLDVSFLPHLIATINSGTVLCLIGAFIAVKSKNIQWHRTFMMSAFVLSAIFLISYVIYHFQGGHTLFGDMNHDGTLDSNELNAVGSLRIVYLILLLSHIVLSVAVVPLVLFSFYFAWSNQIARHKKWVKWSYPIWFYVATTGVIVYFMIRPYYA